MLKTLRYTASLAWDLGEALLAVFNCNNVTDQIWANAVAARRADQLVDKEAGEDVAEPECTCWPDLPYHALDCHLWYGTDSSSVGVGPQPPIGERPPAPPANLVEPEGNPNLSDNDLRVIASALKFAGTNATQGWQQLVYGDMHDKFAAAHGIYDD